MRVEAFTAMSDGLEIHGRMHLPDNYPAPCVICSHGLFSSKDSAKFIAMAQHLSDQGFLAIRYDHRGCGDSQGRLGSTTLTSRLADLAAVYAFARRQTAYANGRFGLMGSSMGGLVSLWAAAKNQAYRAIVTWATPWQIRKSPVKAATSDGVVLDDAFFADLEQYRLDQVLKGVQRCLVVHGRDDELVPVFHAQRIYQSLAEPKCIEVFPEADHRFSNPEHRRNAIVRTAAFLRQYLM